jgi:hypothetical protein
MLLSPEPTVTGPLYVDAMKEDGKITKSEFSFAMNGFDRDMSYLDLGEPDYKKVAGGEQAMVKIDMLKDFFWSNVW